MQNENPTRDSIELTPYVVISALLATMRIHRKHADRFVRSTGLYPTQHRVLMYLSRLREPCRQRELSEHFELTPAAVVQIVDKLESEGYVTREQAQEDNRCKRVVLTERGYATAEASTRAFQEIDAKLLRKLSEEELRIFYRVLMQMQDNMNAEELSSGEEEGAVT